MEHDVSQHWHQSELVHEATREIDRIDLYDTVMVDYENYVAAQQDTSLRVRNLMALTNFYHREFGVHYEKRYAYRDQLHRILVGELDSLSDARVEARAQYGMTDGLGLPKLERLARNGTQLLI